MQFEHEITTFTEEGGSKHNPEWHSTNIDKCAVGCKGLSKYSH